MTLHVGTAAGSKSVSALHVGTAAGTKAVTEGWIGTAAGNKQFYGGSTPPPTSLTADASPDQQFWTGVFPAAQDANVSVTAGGGSGSYAYAWEVVGNATIDDATVANAHVQSVDGSTVTLRCLVTDTVTFASVYSDEIIIQ